MVWEKKMEEEERRKKKRREAKMRKRKKIEDRGAIVNRQIQQKPTARWLVESCGS